MATITVNHVRAPLASAALAVGMLFFFAGPQSAQGVAVADTAPAESRAAGGEAHFGACRAQWSKDELLLANSHFQRKWRIKDGLLTAVSFRDQDAGVEWVAKPAKRPAPCPSGPVAKGLGRLSITARSGRLSPAEEESLLVEAKASGNPAISYQFQIFPAARGVLIDFSVGNATTDAPPTRAPAPAGTPSGIEPNSIAADQADGGDSLEDLLLAPQHLRFTQATLCDQTDSHNELVFENQWLLAPNEAPLKLPGNVFFVEDTLSGAGLIFLKLAPLPHARPIKSEWDAEMMASSRRLHLAGQGYPFVLLAYSGGRSGRIEAMQTFQRQLRRYDPARDGMFLSNTWGDRSRDARVNEPFMLKEIEAGARLGVDVVQIDDGWQKGRTANSASGKGGAWNGYWAADPLFWQPDPQRFPNGLAKVVQAARAKGMKFGLWFGPDTSNEGANWQRDADRLLELYRQEGISYIKLDSVKAITPHTASNFQHLLQRVMEQSDAQVVFDLDVTAEIRPGYFGAAQAGPIFVENRYTDFHRYWPHQTLRNLWKLSQYVDPLRLRMEFLNNTRNREKYADDPLAPGQYPPDALFATVMFSNPLGWFEVSNLPEDYVAAVSKLVTVWKQERARLFSGKITPIGDAPDGTCWTGFTSDNEQAHCCYVLLFRELNAQASWSLQLPGGEKPARHVAILAGRGEATLEGDRLAAHIPEKLQYLFLKIE